MTDDFAEEIREAQQLSPSEQLRQSLAGWSEFLGLSTHTGAVIDTLFIVIGMAGVVSLPGIAAYLGVVSVAIGLIGWIYRGLPR